MLKGIGASQGYGIGNAVVINDAMDMAVELRGDRENTNIYCVGSLYLVGGVKRWRNRHDQF